MRYLAHASAFALLSASLIAASAAGCGSAGNANSGSSGGTGGATGADGSSGIGVGTGGAGTTGANGSTGSGSTGAMGSTSSGSTYTTGAGGAPTVMASCQGHIYQCGDLIDNDGDGLIDSQDPDCLGPCDNTENSYFGGIPGENNAPCKMDCYFDQDSGPGNDDCYWNHRCDPHEVAPGYYPEHDNGSQCAYDPKANTPGTSKTCAELYETQSSTCMSVCGPLTPNGCDCFGCCELPAGGGKYVFLGSLDANGQGSCDPAHVSDPTKCQPCEPVKACLNTCEHCELCLGKNTLPPDCFPGGSTSSATGSGSGSSSTSGSSTGSSTSSGGGGTGQCPAGIQPCGLPGQAACPGGYYCLTGCCQRTPT